MVHWMGDRRGGGGVLSSQHQCLEGPNLRAVSVGLPHPPELQPQGPGGFILNKEDLLLCVNKIFWSDYLGLWLWGPLPGVNKGF